MSPEPLPMRLTCPSCGALHLDENEFATKPHHTHACQECGMVWRPAVVPTVGVRFLPGFKNCTHISYDAATSDECNGPRDCVGTVHGCRHCAPGLWLAAEEPTL